MSTNGCNFIKYYKPPKDKYVIVSFSIFYNKNYIRHTRKSTIDKLSKFSKLNETFKFKDI